MFLGVLFLLFHGLFVYLWANNGLKIEPARYFVFSRLFLSVLPIEGGVLPRSRFCRAASGVGVG